jgi:hypothetical protein
MAVVQAERPDVVLLDIGLTGPRDGLLVGLDIQTFWFTPVIYLSGSDATALGLPDFPEALWCYAAKPIVWHQLRDILARLFPAHPPVQGALGSGGESPPHPIPPTRRFWPTPALRAHMRQLRQPAGSPHRPSGPRPP